MATTKKHTRLPALLGLCLTAALATACASDSSMGRRTTGSSSSSDTAAMGASGGYKTLVPSPTGASGPMDQVPNATGGTVFGTEGAGAF
jgi:hypothetical protein